jgi:hypothetical protein
MDLVAKRFRIVRIIAQNRVSARPSDWVEHEEGVPGSEDIWIAVVGPDTPDRGEVAPYPTVHQADVAATLLRFFGLDPARFNPEAGPPIPAALATDGVGETDQGPG